MPLKKTRLQGRQVKKKKTAAMAARQALQWWSRETRKLSGTRLCARCGAVWFDGHWHTAPALAATVKAGRKRVSGKGESLCYECHYAVHGPADPAKIPFEGQLTLDGLRDVSEKAKILSTVRNFGARASRRDPEDRIISIDDRGERVVVTTTENQMAVGMGKAVDAAFKGGRLRIAWSDGDLPARVYWTHKA